MFEVFEEVRVGVYRRSAAEVKPEETGAAQMVTHGVRVEGPLQIRGMINFSRISLSCVLCNIMNSIPSKKYYAVCVICTLISYMHGICRWSYDKMYFIQSVHAYCLEYYMLQCNVLDLTPFMVWQMKWKQCKPWFWFWSLGHYLIGFSKVNTFSLNIGFKCKITLFIFNGKTAELNEVMSQQYRILWFTQLQLHPLLMYTTVEKFVISRILF